MPWPFALSALYPPAGVTAKLTRFALGELLKTPAPVRPISFSLNMAVFDVPSVTPWVPNEPMLPPPHWQLLFGPADIGTMMPEFDAIEAGPPKLAE